MSLKSFVQNWSVAGFLGVALFLPPSKTNAQWKLTTQNLLGPISQNAGAMTFKAGIAWAASDRLFRSTDSGSTWTATSLTTNGNATSIDFIDDHNGLLVTHQGEVYLTRDGKTWTSVLNLGDATSGIILDSLHMMVSPHESGGEEYTEDGGKSWHFAPADAWDHDLFHGSAPGEAYLLTANWSTAMHLWKTTDYGKTWSNRGGHLDADCWSGVIDPCNPQIIYVPNEEYSRTLLSPDAECALFVSTNAGMTWNVPMQHPPKYWCGSVVVGPTTAFVPTVSEVNEGIFRTTDHGLTWQNIGGPSASGDTRLIAAMDDNRLIAFDANGGSWTTMNSGGHEIMSSEKITVPQTVQTFESKCSGIDSVIRFSFRPTCASGDAVLDSISLNGSKAFTLLGQSSLPRNILENDSLQIHFEPLTTLFDTTSLIFHYHTGITSRDTTVVLIGKSATLANTQSTQHLVLRSGVSKAKITMPFLEDFGDTLLLRTSWPNLSTITATISYDPLRLAFVSYNPPTGWSTSSLSANPGKLQYSIANIAGPYTHPLDLGSADFIIREAGFGMTRLDLQYLQLHVGQSDEVICQGRTEDNLWGIVVKPQSAVSDDSGTAAISVQPNPFGDHIRILDEQNRILTSELIDVLGHRIPLTISDPASKEIATYSLTSGSYLLLCHTVQGIQTFHLTKLR
jgi:hypothetical protein